MEERSRDLDNPTSESDPYYEGYNPPFTDFDLQLHDHGRAVQGTKSTRLRSSDMGRSTLFEGQPEENEESGGFAPVKIAVCLILDRDTVLESPYRIVQSVRHGSAGEMEARELWDQILRRLRLLGRSVAGSNEPVRITITVEVGDDPPVEA